MNPDSEFALFNASWPAFLVDNSALVSAANPAARSLFGAEPPGVTVPFSTIWAGANSLSADEFLAQARQTGGCTGVYQFVVAGGAVAAFRSLVSVPEPRDGSGCLFQLLSDSPGGTPAGGSQAMDASVAQKQKLDCALQLTRTVALDFNNALTSILGHTSLILSKMDPKHPWRGSLLEVEKSAEKAAEIAHDLAAFSRQDKDTRAQVAGNLNQLLRRTVELFQTPTALNINWALFLEPGLYAVVFDEAKLQQALMKILDNAVQAASAGGHVAVSSRNLAVADTLTHANITLSAGDYVCVEIADNGGGIPADVLPRIFEPFFTTKPGHRGLGLAWVYGIVTNHGGTVSVTSRVGQGTTVHVYLPAVRKIVRDSSLADNDLGGNQTILVVDDEDILLTMGQMILSDFGYEVLTANNGQKALEIFQDQGKPIDLVITDLVMPHMSGRELIEHLRRLAPGVRIVCASGFIPSANQMADAELYLQKPFTSQELLRKVKQALA